MDLHLSHKNAPITAPSCGFFGVSSLRDISNANPSKKMAEGTLGQDLVRAIGQKTERVLPSDACAIYFTLPPGGSRVIERGGRS